MKPVTRRSSFARDRRFGGIDRRIAAMFLALTTALLVTVFLVGSALYVGAVRTERERLSGAVATVLGPALEGLKAAGEYKMQRLVDDLVRDTPTLAYVRVVGRDHRPFVAGGQLDAAVAREDGAVARELLDADRGAQRVHDLSLADRPVTEVAMSLRAGYRGEWSGVLRVGIWGESASALLLQGSLIIGGLLAVLLAALYPIVVWLSRRIGAPVQTLALDFEGVMRHAPLHVTIDDATGRIDQASDTFRADFGLGPEAQPLVADHFPPEVFSAPAGERHEVHLPISGEERVFLVTRFPVALSAEGAVVRSGIVAADVTAWRRDQAQRDQLIAAVESTGDLLLIADPSHGVVYANPAFLEQAGHDFASTLGRDPLEVLAGAADAARESRPDLAAITQAAEGAGSWQGRIAARRRDGTTFPCDLAVFPILDASGQVHAHVWSARDVSRQAELETQLLQSQRMEAIGRLAGGVAHDFNNLLTIINGMAELLLDDPLRDEQRTSVTMIAEAGRRAAGLTRQLLAFGRRQTLTIRDVDLNAVIDGALELIRSAVGSRVQVHFERCEGLWPTRGDVGQLEQALMNLAINARDAMPDHGALRLATENTHLVGACEADGAVVPDGDYVVLTVADTGSGMPPSVVEHIFEPFFTTKDVGKGTGLGLAMVHGVVRQSGGHIWVTSAPEEGTTFRVAFPRARVSAVAPTAAAPEAPAAHAEPAPRERVLVVDDDADVRAVVAGLLRHAGYGVETAVDGTDALARLEGPRAPVDLVLTDLVMPGLTGAELARVVRQRHPGLRLMLMSGYAATASDLTQDLGGVRLLQKPPSSATLLAAVREVLAAPAP